MATKIPWRRVGVEGVVIVGSILLALGLDAWWEDRQEHAEKEELLSSLLLELQFNSDRLAQFDSAVALNQTAAVEILAMTSPSPTRPDVLHLDSLLAATVRCRTTTPPRGR